MDKIHPVGLTAPSRLCFWPEVNWSEPLEYTDARPNPTSESLPTP